MHEVENMFSVRETPWHRLGTILANPPTSEDAIRAAGLAWNVELEPLFTAAGEKVDRFAVRRESDRSILGNVGPDYTVLQNGEAFSWFDPFVRAGEARYETAGSLREGRRIWILASLSREPSVIVRRSDDIVKKYLLLSNSHDGSLAVRLGFTPTRVVCANTLAIAHSEKGSQLLRIKHTSGVRDTIEAVREIVNTADARFEATADLYRLLASRNINSEDLERFVRVVFKVRVSAVQEAKNARTSRERDAARAREIAAQGGPLALGSGANDVEEKDPRALAEVISLFEGGRGNQLPGVRGTWWAAYNAVTEYLQYAKRGTDATRLDSLAFGDGASKSRAALDAALMMSTGRAA